MGQRERERERERESQCVSIHCRASICMVPATRKCIYTHIEKDIKNYPSNEDTSFHYENSGLTETYTNQQSCAQTLHMVAK